MIKLTKREWLAQIPKVELHLHIEGAIPLSCLWGLIQKYGGDPDVRCEADLAKKFTVSDFPHFIETWVWKSRFLRAYDDFEMIASAVAEDLKSQNIVYVEAFISPSDFYRLGLEVKEIIRSVRRGLDKVTNIRINLVVDLVRDFGAEHGEKTLDSVLEVATECGVVGVGIGGSEKEFPPEIFKDVYARARETGALYTSAHAGEGAGAESVWGALHELRVNRIGHATRATEDPALVNYLVAHKIPLEMCPLSNLCTAVVHSIKEHPIRRFFDLGAVVTVNTDDPKMFNNSLAEEFEALMTHLAFTRKEVYRLTLNAVEACWLRDQEKKILRDEIASHLAWEMEVEE
jgi:adenosine deaminase